MVVALSTAAGSGTRMGLDIPKQFLHIENKPLIVFTLEAFQRHPSVDAIICVTLPDWIDVLKDYAKQYNLTKVRWIIPGGETGQESIWKGLVKIQEEVPEDEETIVMVHDGNRCLVSAEIISDSLAMYRKHGSAVAAIPCVEAVFYSDDGGVSSDNSISRDKLFRTQTPHTYALEKLIWAHKEAQKRGIKNSVASCTLMHLLGEQIYFSRGSEKNIKITTTDDLAIFKALLHSSSEEWANHLL